jgi:hypothetical protein
MDEHLGQLPGSPRAHRTQALYEWSDRFGVPDGPPPVAGGLAREGNHRRDQDELRDIDAGRDERCCERTERLPNNDQRPAKLMHGLDNGLGVVARSRVRIVERKPRREGLMATCLQLGDRPAPTAGVYPGPRDEDERHLVGAVSAIGCTAPYDRCCERHAAECLR